MIYSSELFAGACAAALRCQRVAHLVWRNVNRKALSCLGKGKGQRKKNEHKASSFFTLPAFCPLADNKDVSVMMSEMDVNAIAGTLKLYFRELPEPLFTDELYPNFAEGIGE